MWKASLIAGLALVGCGGDSGYHPDIDPSHFVSGVDNPWFPLVPGTVMVYDVQETDETVTVTVTDETRDIMGVTCMVVRDTAEVQGFVVEDTYDWYAQDDEGNVWYFGEDTTAFDPGGETSKEGSWEGGVDGAFPGKIALADPQVGEHYREEYLEGEAEDEAEVLELDVAIEVPYGSFDGCFRTHNTTRLEPDVAEDKTYCSGVGNVASVAVSGAPEHELLVSVTGP